MRYIVYTFITLLLLGALVVDFYDEHTLQTLRRASASEQEPRRWRSGDTTWYEIDSATKLPSYQERDSLHLAWDSLHGEWYPPLERDNVHSQMQQLPPSIRFEYRLPYWNVYRRSFTLWGITFSTGQPDPYNPYPASNNLDAAVTSHPLNRPR